MKKYKVGFTNIFGSENHLKQIVESLGGTYIRTDEETGIIGPDAPDTVSIITISPEKVKEIRNMDPVNLWIDNFYQIK